MNDLLYQFQTIGFACDREYHKGMKDVKRSFREMNRFREKSQKNYNNVDNVIDSISNVINNKIEPLSRSVDCRTLTKNQRLQQCLNRMSKIDHNQQQLDREQGNRAMSIFSEKINKVLPQQQKVKEVNEEMLLNSHLQDENMFRQVMEHAILLHQFHKDCNQKYSKGSKNASLHEDHDLQKYYLKKYQINHLRLKDKLIDSDRKTLIEHKYCLDRTQQLKSSRNTQRIKEVTEKLNRNKIRVIQNLFQTGHAHKSQQAAEVLKFLDLYSKLDRENQGFFGKQITICEGITMKVDAYLRRVFFKFSNKQCEDQNQLYKYINREGYLKLFQTTHIDMDEYEINKIYQNNIQVQTVDKEMGLTYNFFRDSLIDIANCITLFPSKEEKLQKLIEHHLTEIYDQVLEPNELRLLNIKSYQDFNLLFRQTIQYLFVGEKMNFDRIIQLFMKIKVFPNKLQKAFLRFNYCYVLQEDEGLDIEQFHHFINLMALSQNKRVAISKELHNIIQFNNFKLHQKCDDIKDFELKVFRKIVIFYFHNDFLNLLDRYQS